MDGWEVLRQIKSDPRLKAIPIVVFTFSRAASDLAHSYQLGANAYVVKPAHLRQRAAVLEEVRSFWIVINELPLEEPRKENGRARPPGAPDCAAGSGVPALPAA